MEKKHSSLSKTSNVLGRANNVLGPGLEGAAALDPENPTHFTLSYGYQSQSWCVLDLCSS